MIGRRRCEQALQQLDDNVILGLYVFKARCAQLQEPVHHIFACGLSGVGGAHGGAS